MDHPPIARLLALGIGAGVMAGVFGIGGGAVLVPGMVLLLGFAQHRAHATSLAAIIVTAPAAMLPFALQGEVAYVPGLAIAVGALAGAYAGAGVMHRISAGRLRLAFAVLLMLLALRLLVGGEVVGADVGAGVGLHEAAGFVLLGVVTGVLSAVMGVGGGVILVPALVLLFAFGQHTAEGTSLLVIIPTALTGALRHARNRYTDWRSGLLVGLGGIGGGLAGAQLALAVPAGGLQRLFGVFLAVVGVLLLRDERRRARRPDAAEV